MNPPSAEPEAAAQTLPKGGSAAPAAVAEALIAQARQWLVATDTQGCIVWASERFLGATGWTDALGSDLTQRLRADGHGTDEALQQTLHQGLVSGELGDTLARWSPIAPGAHAPWLRLRLTRAEALRLWTLNDLGPDPLERPKADLVAAPGTDNGIADIDSAAERLALAVDLARVAIWRHDLRSNRLHYNARGFEVLGMPYRPEGMSLEEVRDMIHPDDVPAVAAAAERALASGLPADVQARYRRIDGSWRHAQTRRVLQRAPDGTPIAFLGVALDLTEQVDEQQRAAEEAHRLSNATAAAGIGVWSRDTVTEESHWNVQMYRLCGRDPALGPPTRAEWVEQIIHPDDRVRMRQAREEVMAGGDQVVEHQYRVVRADGEVRWLVNLARIEHWNGRPVIFGATMDVTERLAAEAALRDGIAAQRLNEARSQLLGRISHELRTPLNAILGFTQLLEIDASAPGRADADSAQRLLKLSHIRQASEHLLGLVNEVLDLSSIEAGQLQLRLDTVALDEVVPEVLADLAAKAAANEVQLSAPPSALAVVADRHRLHQVLAKLISHRLSLVPAGGALRLQAAVEGDEVRLSLSDNGHALTAAQQLQLFEPFGRMGTGTGQESDSGLNLALVKALMACMGGRIDLAGSAQDGTRFMLLLPRAAGPAEAAEAALPEAPGTAPRPGKVLYIEDNPVNVILVEELIAQRGGLELACVDTGAEGVSRAREMQPDLVLIDMQLPDFDGFEVLRQLRSDPSTAGVTCIALSANAMPDDMARALAAGFDDYWTKPIRFARFLTGLDGLFPRRGGG